MKISQNIISVIKYHAMKTKQQQQQQHQKPFITIKQSHNRGRLFKNMNNKCKGFLYEHHRYHHYYYLIRSGTEYGVQCNIFYMAV